MTIRSTPRDTNIHIRADLADRELIYRAAEVSGKSRAEFIIGSARDKAQEVLLDQCIFHLSDEEWGRFLEDMDKPLGNIAELKALFKRKASWDT